MMLDRGLRLLPIRRRFFEVGRGGRGRARVTWADRASGKQ